MHIRLQNLYYRNKIDMMNEDPIVGALDWKNLTELRRRWQAGEIEDAGDESPPAETVKNRPLRRNPGRKSGPGSAQHRGRSSGNVSRSASPSSTRKRNPAPVAWSAEDDEELRR
jgi:hypothetical protein